MWTHDITLGCFWPLLQLKPSPATKILKSVFLEKTWKCSHSQESISLIVFMIIFF